MMRNKRLREYDRRQQQHMPRVPFKDSDGALIRETRRRAPDRRISNIEVEWVDEIEIH